MSEVDTDAPSIDLRGPVLKRLSTLDRFLPVWIIVAMALGIGLGRVIPSLAQVLDKIQVGSVSLPIAVGLLLMMYPVLAKVRYTQLGRVTGDRRLLMTRLQYWSLSIPSSRSSPSPVWAGSTCRSCPGGSGCRRRARTSRLSRSRSRCWCSWVSRW